MTTLTWSWSISWWVADAPPAAVPWSSAVTICTGWPSILSWPGSLVSTSMNGLLLAPFSAFGPENGNRKPILIGVALAADAVVVVAPPEAAPVVAVVAVD